MSAYETEIRASGELRSRIEGLVRKFEREYDQPTDGIKVHALKDYLNRQLRHEVPYGFNVYRLVSTWKLVIEAVTLMKLEELNSPRPCKCTPKSAHRRK